MSKCRTQKTLLKYCEFTSQKTYKQPVFTTGI